MEILKISSGSNPKSVAGAIAAILRTRTDVELIAVGAGAVNQAVKSIAIAREYVVLDGLDPVCVPRFTKIEIDGEAKTALKLGVCCR